MYHFGKSLMPDLETSAAPHGKIAKMVDEGANGRGVYDWSQRDGKALVAERMNELFRRLKDDHKKKPADVRR